MFRIHIKRGNESTSLIIEGKLIGPWVLELERCWSDEMSGEPVKPVIVDLASVSFVDAEGKELLLRMRRRGAQLRARGCLMQAIVREIEAR